MFTENKTKKRRERERIYFFEWMNEHVVNIFRDENVCVHAWLWQWTRQRRRHIFRRSCMCARARERKRASEIMKYFKQFWETVYVFTFNCCSFPRLWQRAGSALFSWLIPIFRRSSSFFSLSLVLALNRLSFVKLRFAKWCLVYAFLFCRFKHDTLCGGATYTHRFPMAFDVFTKPFIFIRIYT